MEVQRQIRWQADEAERTAGVTWSRFRAGRTSDAADRDPLVAQAVVQASRGSTDALRFLYTRYADTIYSYALSLVRDEHEAEDITQQVFLKLMNNLHKYEPRDVPFAAWIVRVARNVAIDHLRDRRQIPCEEVFAPSQAADDVVHERRQDLRSALGQLPEEQRNVVVLRHLVGLSPGEIGERMGKTEASVHGLHHRGRQALRKELVRLEAAPASATRGR
jgi:RNA polymerase sigma-70 factor (ECF subfamily)